MKLFHCFKSDISGIELPARFNNPFYYSPHPLCLVAADEVSDILSSDEALNEESQKGKMFGVLVVKSALGEVGYLMAFSGLLFGRNSYVGFVPPVYDMQSPDGYFKQEESEITAINSRIKRMECDAGYISAKEALRIAKEDAEKSIAEWTLRFKANKEERHKRRATGSLSVEDEKQLIKESQFEKAELKRIRNSWNDIISEKENLVARFNEDIVCLCDERKRRSVALQKWLFEQFKVLNGNGECKTLLEIFDEKLSALPPAGAGECAAPKLLQYAYLNGYTPLAMAEFWIGKSPVGEVRRSGSFYGSCKSKCEPILGFMLQGLDIEESALEKGGEIDGLEILYEDKYLIVVNKPPGVLSVPGIVGGMSVQQWLREEYLHDNNLFVAHRLDMATSGVLVAAKSIEIYKALQKQFAERKVKKYYMALLDGMPEKREGKIELPLASDFVNRPRQKVDYENGKPAITLYRVVDEIYLNGKKCALVRFEPITGRTHQLRVHSASKDGLDCPIMGDALYGTVAERLMLHASSLAFVHPVLNKTITIECNLDFFR